LRTGPGLGRISWKKDKTKAKNPKEGSSGTQDGREQCKRKSGGEVRGTSEDRKGTKWGTIGECMDGLKGNNAAFEKKKKRRVHRLVRNNK